MKHRKLILSMQLTLDGYVAGNNDEADWLISDIDEWEDLFEYLNSADTYLLGRKMYPLYSKYWQDILKNPDSKPSELKFAKLAEKTDHIVFTKGDFKPDWKNTRVGHDLVAEVTRLKKQEGKNIIAWGGANFAASLIENDLVDEYRFELNPTILGGGKRLYDGVKSKKGLKLVEARGLKSGLVLVRWER